jgi:Secretion system C-terminal sorting domain
MLKRIFIFLALGLFLNNTISAQCTPDTSITIPGLYPDSTMGLPDGEVGVPYNEIIQVRVLTDTTSNGFPVVITSITITSVTGLPPGITYQCVPNNCTFPGGSNGCILLSGTPTTAGFYPILVNIQIDGTTFGIPIPSQSQVVDVYSININQSTGIAGIGQSSGFDLLPSYPNPASDYTNMVYATPLDGDFTLGVFNILGKEVFSQVIRGKRGVNTKRINTVEFSPGIYIITLTNGEKILTGKLIISDIK